MRNDSPRYWNWTRQLLVGSIGQEAGDAKQRALTALATPENKNQDDCEQILVECVRKVSQENPSVGKDCVSTVLSRDGQARVRFLSDPNNDAGQTTFTPWILAPRMTVPPIVLAGALPHVEADPFFVQFDRVPSLPPSFPFTASSQSRPQFP